MADTHLILWAVKEPERLPTTARELMEDPENELFFSSVTIWEIAIKQALKRSDFVGDSRVIRRGLLDGGFKEIALTSDHAVHVADLPPIHQDPFDRILIAQGISEDITLLTSDMKIAQYPGPIRRV